MHAVEPTATVVTLPPRGGAKHAPRGGGHVVTRQHRSNPHGFGGSSPVLVLNATYEPIHVCGIRRAVGLLLKEKAEVVETGDGELHAERTSIPRPAIIRLRTFAPVPRRRRRRLTRRAVFARDNWTCQYCGSPSDLTVDHVIPRSKGGSSEWENIVACCSPCNRRKADRLPHQARMFPKSPPRAPHPSVFIRVACPSTPESWESWLGQAA